MQNNATTSRSRQQPLTLPIRLDRTLRSQSQQVHAALRSAIIEGRLAPGTKLPSSRNLAEQLAVRRNAIVSAYEQLLGDGLVDAKHGAGTYVAAELPAPTIVPPKAQVTIASSDRGAFSLGHTYVDPRLLQRLALALRRRVATATPDGLGYGDPRGSTHLRTQIALHLAANRGIRCDPSCIIVVSGTQHAIRLCTDALLSPGDGVLMEDPGYYAAQTTFRVAGMKLVPVAVDTEGMALPQARKRILTAKAAYVTPSHQFPTGVTMSMPRRVALLDWAKATNAWIFEDDYDSEFRYDGPPLTALAGLGVEHVIYIGTFTKTLFASLRLAYIVAPPAVVERAVVARAAIDRFPPGFMQDAVADLMADGELAAHMRRMRSRYREARDAVAAVLGKAAQGALRVTPPMQGLHMIAYLADGVTTDVARAIRQRAKIQCKLLSETRISSHGREGFILGFSGHSLDQLAAAAFRLGTLARDELGHGRRASRTARHQA
jgi:GntR family transcriptional regulator / MocR family aminotransferase